jgi:hypothetical protein
VKSVLKNFICGSDYFNRSWTFSVIIEKNKLTAVNYSPAHLIGYQAADKGFEFI